MSLPEIQDDRGWADERVALASARDLSTTLVSVLVSGRLGWGGSTLLAPLRESVSVYHPVGPCHERYIITSRMITIREVWKTSSAGTINGMLQKSSFNLLIKS